MLHAAPWCNSAILLLPRRLLLQLLHNYDAQQGKRHGRGTWGEARAAAHPLLVHACFCFDRTGHGRMQALLPLLAASPRLLLPPGLLTSSAAAAVGAAAGGDLNSSSSTTAEGGAGAGSNGAGACVASAAAAAAVSSKLLAAAGAAPPDKAEQVSEGMQFCPFYSCLLKAS